MIAQDRPSGNLPTTPTRSKPYTDFVNGRMATVARGDTATRTLVLWRYNSGFTQKPPGCALPRAILMAAQQDGLTHIEVTNRDTGAVYRAQLTLYFEKGIPYRHGHDQIVLPMQYWTRRDLALPTAEQKSGHSVASQGEQLSLFAGEA